MPCPFCDVDSSKFITETDLSFAIYDIHPVTKGHTLIIPKIHIENYFDLPYEYREDLFKHLNKVKEFLESEFSPCGYNIGINVNRSAGQSVMHAHIHIIPRYIKHPVPKSMGVENVIIQQNKKNKL